ncbi:hypothetical protein [uncultured Anaerovibrio sp.]|uniref:hypothetical protein n=1 Tax=uncultured Anaerovibrio sp. TaxID=361586 RepID=UPI00261C7FDD|nr:hypothetical protein [uncultured Anaerovibrio sp.]
MAEYAPGSIGPRSFPVTPSSQMPAVPEKALITPEEAGAIPSRRYFVQCLLIGQHGGHWQASHRSPSPDEGPGG